MAGPLLAVENDRPDMSESQTRPNPSPPTEPSDAPAPTAEPMTTTLMARLFVVPAVIVCILIAVAVVVVLFGSTPLDQPVSIDRLLTILEQDNTGGRTMGMLMPRDKDYWQAAQELANRLMRREKYLQPEEIEPTAERLVGILDGLGPGQDTDEIGPSRRLFIMQALARLGSPVAFDALAERLEDPNSGIRMAALMALAEMEAVDGIERVVSPVVKRLDDPSIEVQMVACATLSQVARPHDPHVEQALREKLDDDREVQWNAAIALARLKSNAGKIVLMNMLDRSYWEQMDLRYIEAGREVQRSFTPLEVSNRLTAAIHAAGHLDDPELRSLIKALCGDASVEVREAARVALNEHEPDSEQVGVADRTLGPQDSRVPMLGEAL